jgi:hypothetical protein
MEIRIVIDAPRGWKRRALLLCGALLGVVTVPAVIAHAYDTSWISSGAPVSASALAADLNEAQTRIAALEAFRAQATADGGYSLGGTYCGFTASTGAVFSGPGTQTGYASARAQCQALTGCSATVAHMCTPDELVRTKQLGRAITYSGGSGYGWIASGVGSGTNATDCTGWTVGTTTAQGGAWYESPPTSEPALSGCQVSNPILCCN